MINSVEWKNLCVAYGDTEVIHNLSLNIENGEFVTIIGTSGCGKTTLMKTVNGLVMPKSGTVITLGEDTARTDLTSLRRKIGYVLQGSVLFPNMNVEKNISFVPRLIDPKDKAGAAETVARLIKLVGLEEDMLKRYPDQLSGGQQQRVGIARALAASPALLLMDEPFSAVDEITRLSLQDEIKRIYRETGVTVLFVTHDIREAVRLGTKLLVMDKGVLQQYGTPEEILSSPANEYVEKLARRAGE
ncbi:MAG: ABC transporter ATP-binding protein [Eubacteriales bacterium]|nr:ABC transporter ATP-binding protein [Eubacteriales bacterium]